MLYNYNVEIDKMSNDKCFVKHFNLKTIVQINSQNMPFDSDIEF